MIISVGHDKILTRRSEICRLISVQVVEGLAWWTKVETNHRWSYGVVATAGEFVQALKDHPRIDRTGDPVTASAILGQECIGRTLGLLVPGAKSEDNRGCDWAAYGLIPGPLKVLLPNDQVVRSFPVAPAPDVTDTP